MIASPENRSPSTFEVDDPRLSIETTQKPQPNITTTLPAKSNVAPRKSWSGLFFAGVGGLIGVLLLTWLQDTILSLFERNDWLGWIAVGFCVLAFFALFMMIVQESIGLLRFSSVTALRQKADLAVHNNDSRLASEVGMGVRALFAGRPELAEPIARLKRHDRDILDARQILILTERELIAPADRAARITIGTAGRRVAVVTSLSPLALGDVMFVLYQNFKMLRALATIYGGRPGFLTILKLLRMIAVHLTVTGSLALTDGFLQQIIGHSLTAKVSRRLGEGLVNGGFTLRVGIAAIEVLRPLPYIEAQPPRLREFVAEFLRLTSE